MNNVFLAVSLLIAAPLCAQPVPDGATYCAEGKIRQYNQLATNPRARVQYPGDTRIDMTYYGLNLRLTHQPNYLRGAATLSLKSTQPGLSQFFLDLQDALQVDSVKVGESKLGFTHEKNQLLITPARPLAAGEVLTLTVWYQGWPGRSLGSVTFSTHGPNSSPVIWTLSEPYGASDWFPNKDTPADKADSSAVSITAVPYFVSVSNGTLIDTTHNADGTHTYRWRNRYPIAPYLISVAMTNYERYDTPFTVGNQTLPVTHYLYPEALAGNKPNLDQTPAMLGVFSRLFGAYPFWAHKYGHAQFGIGGGMEHQTISSMGSFSPYIIAHELAHQWFGDKITCRDWQNIWLNEGFASYAEALYTEASQDKKAYNAYMANFMSRARQAKGTLYVQDISSFGNIFDGNRTYAKGATVLHMLRGIVGDSTFVRILRAYTASPVAYSTAITDDFQHVAEQVSGQNLDYFFKEWVYGEGYPAYQVSYSPISATQVRVQIEQTARTNPTFFTMPVQIRVQSAGGDTTVTVLNNQVRQGFTLPTRGTATGVVFDPNSLLLRDVAYVAYVPPLTATEPEPSALRVYPNPTTETLTVQFTTDTPGPITLTLTNLAGQAVAILPEVSSPAGLHIRTLSVQKLPAGRYIVRVQTGSKAQTAAVLIQR